ncbi:unnamed protein product [Hapterophycus canaliculatus]
MSSVDSYRIKRVRFFGRKVPILCQNENGPCPLLAIANVLLLQSNISIHPDLSEITFNELTQLVAGFLLDSNPPHEDLRINVNQQTQLDTVIKLLPRLQYGLDVNVRFNSVRGFEFTEEMAAFDMSGITLLHGWLLDPEDTNTAEVLQEMSYNKLVEKLLDFRSMMADVPEQCDQGSGAAGSGREVMIGTSESKLETQNVAASTDEEAVQKQKRVVVGQGQAGRDDGEGVVEDRGEEPIDGIRTAIGVAASEVDFVQRGASSASRSAHNEGPNSVLHDEAESSTNATALREGQVAEDFFRETASQLTYFGLSQLHQEVRERQLCVFFRNNHFSTMFKYEGKLYLLITDLGYARESSVVWEKLDQIDGNTAYADSDFGRSSRCNVSGGDLHDDADYVLALALQEEDASGNPQGVSPGQSAVLGDEAMAMALHQEERVMLERRIGSGHVAPPREGVPLGEERDRRRPAESVRRNRPENGSACLIQ